MMLTKQNQVLSNLATLDEEEAQRAQMAAKRWQVSSDIPESSTLLCSCGL